MEAALERAKDNIANLNKCVAKAEKAIEKMSRNITLEDSMMQKRNITTQKLMLPY